MSRKAFDYKFNYCFVKKYEEKIIGINLENKNGN